jgi:hypothetical protein
MIAAVAVAVVSFFFIDNYNPRVGLIGNIIYGEIQIAGECEHKASKNLNDFFDQLTTEISGNQLEKDLSNRVDAALREACVRKFPYKWIFALSSIVIALGLMFKTRIH